MQKSRAEKLTFCVPGRDLAAILTVPKRSQAVPGALFLASRATFRDSPGCPGACRAAPRGFQNALGMLSERPWAPRGVLRGSRDRFSVGFGCPGAVLGSSWHRFGIDVHVGFRIDFSSELTSKTDTDVACSNTYRYGKRDGYKRTHTYGCR